MKPFTGIIILLLLIGGLKVNSQNRNDSKLNLGSVYQSKLVSIDNTGIPYYQCNEFVYHALDSINIKLLSIKYSNILNL